MRVPLSRPRIRGSSSADREGWEPQARGSSLDASLRAVRSVPDERMDSRAPASAACARNHPMALAEQGGDRNPQQSSAQSKPEQIAHPPKERELPFDLVGRLAGQSRGFYSIGPRPHDNDSDGAGDRHESAEREEGQRPLSAVRDGEVISKERPRSDRRATMPGRGSAWGGVRVVSEVNRELKHAMPVTAGWLKGSETSVTLTQQPNHRSWHPREQPLGTGRSTLRRTSVSLRRPRESRGNEPVAGRDHRR